MTGVKSGGRVKEWKVFEVETASIDNLKSFKVYPLIRGAKKWILDGT